MTLGRDDVSCDFDVRRVAGAAWTDRFDAPRAGVRALDAVISTPSRTGLCVVLAGTAFLGEVLDPATFHAPDLPGPVAGMLAARDEHVLLLHDVYDEREVLVRGTVRGAQVLP